MTDIAEDQTATELRVRETVSAYVAGIGLQGADFDAGKRLDLTIDGRPAAFCFIGGARPALWIASELGPVDPDDREALLWLLRAGMEPWMLCGQRIGLIPESATAIAYATLDAAAIDDGVLDFAVNALLRTAADAKRTLDARDFSPTLN
jgi:hypothetical protein